MGGGCQHHGRFDLALRNRPIGSQQRRLECFRHEPEAVPLIKADRPGRRRPGADQDLANGLRAQMRNQGAADAASLISRQNIGVANQIHVAHGLDAHYSGQCAIDLAAHEVDPRRDLGLKLGGRHVGLVPAIRRDGPAIGLGRRIDDRQHRFRFIRATRPDARGSSAAKFSVGWVG
jgi:hypothetical protein